MNSTRRRRPLILARSIGALLAISGFPSFAIADDIWVGGGANGNWSTGANWNTGVVPSFANPLQFGGSLQLTTNNDAAGSVVSITFNPTAGAFTLNGNPISLTGGITNSSANTQTVSFGNIKLAGSQTFNAGSAGGSLAVMSNMALGSNTLTIIGSNNANLNGIISGTGGLTMKGTGTLGLGGLNTYSGPTTVDSGTLLSVTSSTLSPNSDLTVAGTGFLSLQGTTSTIGALNDGGATTGTVQNGAASGVPATLTIGNTGNNGSYGGTITDGGSGPLSITKIGPGTQALSGNNSYSGGTLLQGGELDVNSNSALGTGTLTVQSAANAALPILGSTASNVTFNNTISIQSNFGVTSPGNLILAGTIDLNGATRVIIGTNNQAQIQFMGTIQSTGGTGGITLNTSGLVAPSDGTSPYVAFIFNNATNNNTYSGLTTVNNGAYLVLQPNSTQQEISGDVLVQGNGVLDFLAGGQLLSPTSTVTVNSTGSTINTGGGPSTFAGMELYGHSTAIGTLLGNGTVGLGSSGVLTVGAGYFSGTINDGTLSVNIGSGGSIVKNTTGTLILAGANTYTGTTNVTAGTLVARSATALGSGAANNVTVSQGAALNYAASANAKLAIGGTLAITGGAGTAIGGSIGSTTTSAEVNVAGAATVSNAALAVNIYGIGGVSAFVGSNTYTLIHGGAGSSLNPATAPTLGTVYNNTDFTVNPGSLSSTATDITVGITGGLSPLTSAYWKGTASPGLTNVWAASDGNANSNWASSAKGAVQALIPGFAADVFISAASPLGTAPTATVLGADMSIRSLTINDTTNGLGLNADGYTLTITPSSSTAGITINSGVPASNIGANLALGASQTWTNNSTNLFTVGGKVNNGSNNLTVTGTGNTIVSGVIGSGTGGLTKNGPGTLTLAGANTYTGATTISGGTLQLGNGGTTGSIAAGSTIANNGTLAFNRSDTLIQGVEFNGVISGTGGVAQIGTGTTTLTGANTYTGSTSVAAGVLNLAHPNALQNSTLTTGGITFDSALSTHSFFLGGLGGKGNIVLADNATNPNPVALNVGVNNASTTYSGVLSGPGSLTKFGTGTLTVSGANTFAGDTNIDNGILVLNGSVQSPTVHVNFAGTLMGTGMAMHDVRNAGILSPGNSPGTFHIGGNYTQTGAGTLVIEVAGAQAGQHDLVAVRGRAALDGSLRIVNVGNARLKLGDKVTFLTATGGVSGTFANVGNQFAAPSVSTTTNAAGATVTTTELKGSQLNGTILDASVVYDSNAVSLLVTQGSFELFAKQQFLTPNQLSVASMLDDAASSPRQKKLIAYLDSEPLAKLPHDFDLIAPDEMQAIYSIGMAQANAQTANLQHRLEDVRAGRTGFSAEGLAVSGASPSFLNGGNPGSSGVVGSDGRTDGDNTSAQAPASKELKAPGEQRYGVFITGTGEFTHVGDTTRASGYDLSTGGFTIGVDYRVNEHFTVGINTGYARTGSDGSGSRVTVDGAKLGAYATYFTGDGFYADAAIQGGYNSYDTRRSALQGTASGSTTGGEFNLLVATGFDFTSDALRVGPIASLQYTNIGFSGFQESGSLAPLRYGSQSSDSIRSALGMKAAYELHYGSLVIRPEMRAAWQHEMGDIPSSIDSSLAGGGPKFTVQGAETGRESLLLSLGVAVLWNERTSTYLYYDGELLRSNYSSNNVSAGVRMTF